MGLRTMIQELATERGVQIDESDLDLFSDEETPDTTDVPDGTVFSEPIPGRAAGRIELFLAANSTTTKEPVTTEGSELLWYPIIREGQWAVRPGTTGSKKRIPLKIVAGKSQNQRRQIGLQDLLDAYDDQAVQHVTVPSSHSDTLFENQGFIDAMKIVDGQVKNKLTGKTQTVKVLMGGYRITEPDAKAKILRGTFANRSAGILYDYVNTETGKKYAAVVDHVALTNKPWITGMASFGRKLKEGTADPAEPETVALSLSDDGPNDDEYALALSNEAALEETDQDFLADEASDWSKEDSPGWLRKQVTQVLDDARQAKLQNRKSTPGSYVDYDYPPRYRCVEARPGQALISDDYGDEANHWSAPITVAEGAVSLADFSQWKPIIKAFIPDERPAPPADKLPLSGDNNEADNRSPKTALELAQEERAALFGVAQSSDNTKPREVVEQNMGDTNETGKLQLSAEAQAMIQAAEARAKAAEDAVKLAQDQISRLSTAVNGGVVDNYVKLLADDDKGLGLSEERGFGGVLTEIRALMLADDGKPVVQSEHFSTDSNKEGTLTLSEGLQRVFDALIKTTEGKKSLGEQLSQPADGETAGETGGEGASGEAATETGTQASTTTTAGKPGGGDAQERSNLSVAERTEAALAASPQMAAVLGRRPKAATAAKGGE